jgi:hypothetical protein
MAESSRFRLETRPGQRRLACHLLYRVIVEHVRAVDIRQAMVRLALRARVIYESLGGGPVLRALERTVRQDLRGAPPPSLGSIEAPAFFHERPIEAVGAKRGGRLEGDEQLAPRKLGKDLLDVGW